MSIHRHYIRNQLSYIRLTLADHKNSHSILKLVSQGIHVSINQFRNLPICTKHSTLGCITELTCSNLSHFNLYHLSFTLLSLSPKVCTRICPTPSESLSLSTPRSLSFDIPPKLLFALCLEIAEACKLISSVQSSSLVMQTSCFTPF